MQDNEYYIPFIQFLYANQSNILTTQRTSVFIDIITTLISLDTTCVHFLLTQKILIYSCRIQSSSIERVLIRFFKQIHHFLSFPYVSLTQP
ncbi:hypothetical protein ACJX0J_032873, partial [Zea mays]